MVSLYINLQGGMDAKFGHLCPGVSTLMAFEVRNRDSQYSEASLLAKKIKLDAISLGWPGRPILEPDPNPSICSAGRDAG